MSTEKYTRPVDPLVDKNPFRQIASRPDYDIPDFAEVRPLLPNPVLPQHSNWIELYWWTWRKTWQHLRLPPAGSRLIAPHVSAASNQNLFMWDTAFVSQFALYARRAFPAMGGLENFYARQHNDGFICRELAANSGDDLFYPFDPSGAGANVLAWAEWRYFRQTGDEERLQKVFWPLVAHHRWQRQNRTWQNGLYWATGMSSGMDNQPRVPDSNDHHRHWSWVDATMQASLSCMVLEQIATLLNESDLALEMSQERVRLQQTANDLMWQEATQFYHDVDAYGRFSSVKSIGAYWALLDKEMTPPKRQASFVQHLRDSWSFNLPHRVPSQSADSEGYNAETGNYWRGAVWPATNFMVLKGLEASALYSLAHAIAVNHLTQVSAVFQQTQTVWENYAPETAAPGNPAKPDFIGTSGLSAIAILLEDVIGIHVDWPQRRVTWERRLDANEPYGVQNLPVGMTGTINLMGDAKTVTVTTDTPFTLIIRDGDQSLQTAVASGVTEIRLD